jgi:hypothetical protein
MVWEDGGAENSLTTFRRSSEITAMLQQFYLLPVTDYDLVGAETRWGALVDQ